MNLSNLADQIEAASGSCAGAAEEDRKRLLRACEKLRDELESPFDTALRLLTSIYQPITLRVAIDMKLFDAVAELNSSDAGPITVEQLANHSGADSLLVARIVRYLAATGVLKETADGTFNGTPFAAVCVSSSPIAAGIIHMTHFMLMMAHLPDYFREKGYKSPSSLSDGCSQFALHTNEVYFDWLKSNPYYQQAFNKTMALSQRRGGKNWFTFFPVDEKLQIQDSSDTVLVDVGGGQGSDLLLLKQSFPDLQGRLVVQDLSVVINDIPSDVKAKLQSSNISAESYDFFTEQPIRHARAYFLRTVLHDWPDVEAAKILTRVREAMGPDSLLLISELVVPDSHVSLAAAQTDLSMMTTFSSLERTRKQWEQLLDSAGLELVKIWTPETAKGEKAATLMQQASLLESKVRS